MTRAHCSKIVDSGPMNRCIHGRMRAETLRNYRYSSDRRPRYPASSCTTSCTELSKMHRFAALLTYWLPVLAGAAQTVPLIAAVLAGGAS